MGMRPREMLCCGWEGLMLGVLQGSEASRVDRFTIALQPVF